MAELFYPRPAGVIGPMHGKLNTTALEPPPSAVKGWAGIALVLLFSVSLQNVA
ncbi:hypothetical protein AAII07_45270 [Microvirga sp. 0TCS3.31]